MNIIPNGTTVTIIGTEMKGTILCAMIEGMGSPHLSYKIVWWAGGIRHSDWVETFEIEVYTDNSKKPGMVNYDEPKNKLLT